MQNFYNYSQKDTNFWNIKNSIITYIPKHKEIKGKNLFKSNNIIRGSYKDKVLKDFILISSSGFKKDFHFVRGHVDNNIIQRKNYTFINYFSVVNTRFSFFHFHPIKYYNNFLKSYFKKRHYILKYINKTIKFKERNIQSAIPKEYLKNIPIFDYKKNFKKNFKRSIRKRTVKQQPKVFTSFWSTFNSWRCLKQQKIFFNYNKKIFVNLTYKNIFFINEIGILQKFKTDSFRKTVFAGLVWILPFRTKKIFKKMLLLFNLIITYYNNIYKLNDKRLFATVILYSSAYKYYVTKFYKLLRKRKIKLRKSNKFLFRYTHFLKKKCLIIVRTFRGFFLANLGKNLFKNKLLTTIVYNPNSYLFSDIKWLQDFNFNLNNYDLSFKVKFFKNLINTIQSFAVNKLNIQLTEKTITNTLENYILLKQNLISSNIKNIIKISFLQLSTNFIKLPSVDYFYSTKIEKKKSLYLFNNTFKLYHITRFLKNKNISILILKRKLTFSLFVFKRIRKVNNVKYIKIARSLKKKINKWLLKNKSKRIFETLRKKKGLNKLFKIVKKFAKTKQYKEKEQKILLY